MLHKDPYFTNFIHTSRFSHNNQDSNSNINSERNSDYSEIRLFQEVLIRKGFNELEQLPSLLDKLLLTTSFNSIYSGFAREVKRHIKPTLTETLKSWIEEAGTTYRADLSLFLYYLWSNEIHYPDITFNEHAVKTPGTPLLSFDSIEKFLALCEYLF